MSFVRTRPAGEKDHMKRDDTVDDTVEGVHARTHDKNIPNYTRELRSLLKANCCFETRRWIAFVAGSGTRILATWKYCRSSKIGARLFLIGTQLSHLPARRLNKTRAMVQRRASESCL